MRNLYQSHNYESFYDFKFGVGDYVPWFPSHAKIGTDQISVGRGGGMPFLLDMRTIHTRKPIFTFNSLKDEVSRNEVPLKVVLFQIWTFGVIFLKSPTNFASSREDPAKMKRSNY